MDITAQELRGIHPHEAFRGYQRDEVDELLDRAAVTIEQLEREVRTLKVRPSKARAATAVSTDDPAADPDLIHRALLLAQTTADKAVAEAEAHAERVIIDSETRAHSLVSEAEANTRRIADTERGRLEQEIDALTSKRNALTEDVEVLEGFASEFRAHIQRAIDDEVERLHRSAVVVEPPGPRPELKTGEMAFTASSNQSRADTHP